MCISFYVTLNVNVWSILTWTGKRVVLRTGHIDSCVCFVDEIYISRVKLFIDKSGDASLLTKPFCAKVTSVSCLALIQGGGTYRWDKDKCEVRTMYRMREVRTVEYMYDVRTVTFICMM